MTGFHMILVEDVLLVVECIASVEPVHEVDRAGRPVMVRDDSAVNGLAPKVVGSRVTMKPGNEIPLRHTPEQLGAVVAAALGGDEAVSS